MDDSEDSCYAERARLLSFLSTKYPSHLAIASDAMPGFQYVVCIHFPAGQGAWHISDDDTSYFRFLNIEDNDWDGHSTDMKYERIEMQACYEISERKCHRDKGNGKDENTRRWEGV